MRLECPVVYYLIKCSGEVKRDGVKMSLLSFSEEVLDAYVNHIEETGGEQLVVALQITISGLIFLDMDEASRGLLYKVTLLVKNNCENAYGMIDVMHQITDIRWYEYLLFC